MQHPLDGLYVHLSRNNFYWENVNGEHFGALLSFVFLFFAGMKNNQAMTRETQNGGDASFPWACNQDANVRRIWVEIVPQYLFFRGHPVIEIKTMDRPPALKNRVSAFFDGRPDDFPVLLFAAIQRDDPVVQALASMSSQFILLINGGSLLADQFRKAFIPEAKCEDC